MAAAARVSRRARGVGHVRIHLSTDASPRPGQQLVDAGRIGDVRQVRAQYLQDWLRDPDAPMTWRLDKAKAGRERWETSAPTWSTRPVAHRPVDHRRFRDHGDIRDVTAAER